MTFQHNSRPVFAFYVIALLIPVGFFVLLELGLRYFDYGEDLSLFIPAPEQMSNEPLWMTNPQVSKRYFTEAYLAPIPPEEYFRQSKPDNGYRIFVMGGSTSATWPYPRNVLFSRLLAQRLSDAFPDRYIEVVNTGIAAVNSFTLLDFIDEILAQQPDAILIYAGHNEFYGALGAGSTRSVGQSRWLINSYLSLSKLKVFQLIRGLVDGGKNLLGGSGESLSSHSTLMSQMVGDNSIAYGSATYHNTKRNFEANVAEIIAKAQAAGVSVMLSELVSNLRDHPPFISVDDGTHLPADLIYAWARQLDQQQMHGMAREAYAMAKDLDGLRFRAAEEINESIHTLATQFNVPVVPMKAYFENQARDGIIGKELMLEHLHPNVEGYILMSEAFFHTLKQQHFIDANWDTTKLRPDRFYRQAWPVTDLDRALGDIRIINLTDNYPYPPKAAGERSIATYEPGDLEETLALKVFNQEISFAEAHMQLAEHYSSQNRHDLAFREYQALMTAAPYDVNFYLATSNYLINRKQYEQALAILRGSLQLKETGYANKWIGQILLLQQRPGEARPYLETALSYFPEDVQIIYNLGFINISFDQVDQAHVSIGLLERIAPESKQLEMLKNLLNEHKQRKINTPPG